MALKIYRPQDGKAVRWGAVAVFLLLAAYAAQSWYFWSKARWGATIRGLPFGLGVGDIGMTLIFLGTVGFGYWLCFVKPKASNFLIEVEIELRKVTWPSVKPWFSTKSEVWASTYVVLAVVTVLVVFIYLVDFGLSALSEFGFYR